MLPFIATIGLCAQVARAQAPGVRAVDGPPSCPHTLARRVCLVPRDLRRIYNVDPLLSRGVVGKGRTIALIVSFGSPTLRADLHAFDRVFGLPDPTLTIRTPLGPMASSDTGWQAETTLDVEWAHVMAPAARLLVMESPVNETEGLQGLPQFLALERLVVQHRLADVISQSWAATEDTLLDPAGRAMVNRFHQVYSQAAARGITVVGASGDDGTAGLDSTLRHFFPYRVTQWPASDPLVLAVGGTQLASNRPNGPEIAWQGSGGGFSKLFGEPAYQQHLSSSDQPAFNGRRGLPDVALNAGHSSPVVIRLHGRWALAGGTSAATPQWAGLAALADSLAGHDLGQLQPALYALADSPTYVRDFRDITQGTINDPPDGPHATLLHAARGWDPATGLGTPQAASLLPDLVYEIRTEQRIEATKTNSAGRSWAGR